MTVPDDDGCGDHARYLAYRGRPVASAPRRRRTLLGFASDVLFEIAWRLLVA